MESSFSISPCDVSISGGSDNTVSCGITNSSNSPVDIPSLSDDKNTREHDSGRELKDTLYNKKKDQFSSFRPPKNKNIYQKSLPHDITEMHPAQIREDVFEKFEELDSQPQGLSSHAAKLKLDQYGLNKIEEPKESKFVKYISFFTEPLSIVLEITALLSLLFLDYIGFVILVLLLLLNATIAFFEDRHSKAQVHKLKDKIRPTCKCFRDGVLQRYFDPYFLVPGDVISMRIGDVVPADCILIGEESCAKVDQSIITGESFPEDKFEGDMVYSGTVIHLGEVKALVTATGTNTTHGKATQLINTSTKKSHMESVVTRLTVFCIGFVTLGCILELVMQFAIRKKPCHGLSNCQAFNNIFVLLAGGIPTGLPIILSIMMSLAALDLANHDTIVLRVPALEEIASMRMLCLDKTGTITSNHLSITKKPLVFCDGYKSEDILLLGALASRSDSDDIIDIAILDACTPEQLEHIKKYTSLFYHPFDPEEKWTYAKLMDPGGNIIHVAKGAPRVIYKMCNHDGDTTNIKSTIVKLARRGYRSIGIAISDEYRSSWRMVGLLPLFDPPRPETKEFTIQIRKLGIDIKMLTGDELTIAKETARQLKMGTKMIRPNILAADDAELKQQYGISKSKLIYSLDGFAEVLPQDKYDIIVSLQKHHIIVGMTGDGVNDGPSLKRANVGIAVQNAADSAKLASDIVVVSPGLSAIVPAIKVSRMNFQRMKSYVVYSITASIRITLSFTILTMVFDYYFPAIAIALFALFNDASMIALTRDNTTSSKTPKRWDLRTIFILSTTLGLYLTASTVLLYFFMHKTKLFQTFGLPELDPVETSGVIYLQLSVTSLSIIFCTRTHKWFFQDKPSIGVILAFLVCQSVASVIGAYGLGGYSGSIGGEGLGGGGWGWVLTVWIYSIITFIPVDFIKKIALWAERVLLEHRVKPAESVVISKKQNKVFNSPQP